tara:strand:+ start:112 stop:957 length:846 start_codon:yes stop_codon:yes gene_type:complete
MQKTKKIISFQGIHGAYSDLVCRKFFKDFETLPCKSFEDTLESVETNESCLALIPVENSIAGRVSDMHLILRDVKLKIIHEFYHRIEHNLLVKKNAVLSDIKQVFSHEQALAQCKKNLRLLKLTSSKFIDTAGAASYVSESKKKNIGAIASSLASKIYGLRILKKNLEDDKFNITRFLVFSKKSIEVDLSKNVRTTIVFETKNTPASLYNALGGFAKRKINLSRLESFVVNSEFKKSSFLLDIEAHPKLKEFEDSMIELKKYSQYVRIVGFYEAKDPKSNK